MSGLSYNNKQMQHITLIDRLNASQAKLWQLWHAKRQTENASAEFLQLEKLAYQEHAALLKQARKINKMNSPSLPVAKRQMSKQKFRQAA